MPPQGLLNRFLSLTDGFSEAWSLLLGHDLSQKARTWRILGVSDDLLALVTGQSSDVGDYHYEGHTLQSEKYEVMERQAAVHAQLLPLTCVVAVETAGTSDGWLGSRIGEPDKPAWRLRFKDGQVDIPLGGNGIRRDEQEALEILRKVKASLVRR